MVYGASGKVGTDNGLGEDRDIDELWAYTIQEVVHSRCVLFQLLLVEEVLQGGIDEVAKLGARHHLCQFRNSGSGKLLFEVDHVRDDLVADHPLGKAEPKSAEVLQSCNHPGHACVGGLDSLHSAAEEEKGLPRRHIFLRMKFFQLLKD